MSEFKVETVLDGEVLIVRPLGYFDENGGQAIKTVCEKNLAEGKILYVLNLKDTPVINSTGLSILLDLVVNIIDYNNGRVGIFGLTKITRNALRMTGVLNLCREFPNETEAVAGIKE